MNDMAKKKSIDHYIEAVTQTVHTSVDRAADALEGESEHWYRSPGWVALAVLLVFAPLYLIWEASRPSTKPQANDLAVAALRRDCADIGDGYDFTVIKEDGIPGGIRFTFAVRDGVGGTQTTSNAVADGYYEGGSNAVTCPDGSDAVLGSGPDG